MTARLALDKIRKILDDFTLPYSLYKRQMQLLDEIEIALLGKRPPEPKSSKWHRVEDELPDNNRDVLVKTDVRIRLDIAWLDKEGSWRCPTTKAKITHWRELPKPPEA